MNRPAVLLFACAAILPTVAPASRAQNIAVYGAEDIGGQGSELITYLQPSGGMTWITPFQIGVGMPSCSPSTTIEDIAYNAWGRLYALGKPGSSGQRAVYKSSIHPNEMLILFQIGTYDAAVDGSIAVSPTGEIAVCGAASVGGNGSSLTVYDEAGNLLDSLLFQTGLGTASWSLSTTIEDIAYDATGQLYAFGKPQAGTKTSVFKRGPGGEMDVLFEQTYTWDSAFDGSLAISPTGDIAVYGGHATFNSARVYNQAGTLLNTILFQTSLGGSSWSITNTIEDIAYDSAGKLYAVGKPNSSTKRAVFKAGSIGMDVLFETSTYSSIVDGSIAIDPPSAWHPAGSGVPGFDGFPELEGQGSMAVGSGNVIRLSHARPSSIATLVIGFTAVHLPFKGGSFIPAADLTLPLLTNAAGSVSLPFVMPAGLPADTEIWLQCWQPDVAAIEGYAATNGLVGIAP